MAQNPRSEASRPTGPDPVKDPESAGQPRAAGAGGPGGTNAPEPTTSQGRPSEAEVREIARRQVEEFNKQFQSGGASRYAAAEMMTQMQADPVVWEVVVDQWGAEPQLTRGMRVTEDTAPYDPHSAEMRGVLRRLSVAEMRNQTPHPTLPLTGDGLAVDEALLMAGRFHAGFRGPEITGTLSDPMGNPVTVTTSGGPAEPPGHTKPTLPGPDNGVGAARPVITIEQGQDPRSAVEDFFADQERQAGPQRSSEPQPSTTGTPASTPTRR